MSLSDIEKHVDYSLQPKARENTHKTERIIYIY